MVLEAGQRLGPYVITGAIGAGGMGEVYRAKDTKLGRDVAIKILPEDFVRDPERLARFKREAQVLASLNHPNIAAIHGLEEHESQPFLVLELVEGEDLAERLMRGRIPVDEVIEIAKQVAEALEEAHEKSIIHRDLKPANVKQTPDGVVKVLDFGLAKALQGAAAQQEPDLSNSPTMTRNATQAGVVLGTAAYMSPEQAKGKAVDRRADIWSFGVLVYEMLTGTKAFARGEVSETLAAILRDEPDWNRLPAQTPSRLRSLLERCLRKNPRERQRDIGDVRLELSSGMDDHSRSVDSSRPRGRTLIIAIIAFALGALLVGVFKSATVAPPRPVTKMLISLPNGLRLVETRTSPIAVSPNGRSIAYAAEVGNTRNIFLHPLDADEASVVPGTVGGHTPFFSPDGEWLGFFTDDALMKVPLNGGAPMVLAPAQVYSLGASWGHDGTIVYVPEAGADAVLMRISQAGGEPEPLSQIGALQQPSNPQLLADGTVLYNQSSTESGVLLKLSTESSKAIALDTPEGAFSYLPSGHLLHWSASSIAASPYDIKNGKVVGDGAVVLEGVATDLPSAPPYLAVAESGTLAYVSGTRQDAALLTHVQRSGESRTLTRGVFHAPRASPSGDRIGYNVGDIWLYDLARETHTRLTVGGGVGQMAWSSDGQRIAFRRADAVFQMPQDGSREPQVLIERQLEVESWSRDGRYLALTEANPVTALDIWTFPTDGEPTPFLVTSASENAATFSPNGRFIAYLSNESGRDEVYVRPFPAAQAKWKISTNGGTAPVWSRDGTELFYREREDVMATSVNTDAEFDFGTPRLIISGNYVADGTGHAGYDVMPDGSFILVERNSAAPLTEIHVVLNWFEELNRLVPTK